jgi:glycine cleavage system H protein
MNYPENYYFTLEREWVLFVSDNIAKIGLTELAIRELQPIRRVEIHTVGQTLLKNQVFGRMKNDTILCKLIMPFEGVISEANHSYLNNPETINGTYSYNDWIVKVTLKNPVDKSNLFSFDSYKVHKTDKMFHLITYLLPRPQKN